MYYGELLAGDNVDFKFTTVNTAGAPATLSGTPVISVYKNNDTTQSTAGVTLTVDFDGVTGLNHLRITTSSDATFYANGNDYQVIITTGTISGTSAVGYVLAHFSLGRRKFASAAIQSVWDKLTSELTTANSVGKLLTDNVNATIGSRATQTSVDTIDDFLDTEVAAIKAKTDLLPEGIKKNTAFNNFSFMMLDSTTGAGKTGIADGSFTKRVAIDGATSSALSGTISEIDSTNMPGWYKINLTAGELNGDNIVLRFAASGAKESELWLKTSP